ncbi:MAG: carboxypeptidase-like regulatory domain-containing protein [Pirellulaceae bacterium]|nr:carboxypeptidase-like regulatory domain-containing protein [Pirellulaceae bacterium]
MHDIASRVRGGRLAVLPALRPRGWSVCGRAWPWTLPARLLPAAVLLGSLGWGGPAEAHKVQVFAAVRGQQIEGHAYVAGGDPVRGRPVRILDPAGQLLGETVTDQDGRFTFQPDRVCDHTLVVDAGLGHKARFTVPAQELPAERVGADPAAAPSPVAAVRPTAGTGSPSDAELATRIESLQQQVIALRADIDKWKTQLRTQDVLGGIGYILGVTGLAFYVLGFRRKNKPC